MINSAPNKSMNSEQKEIKTKESYFFPDHGVTITASSQEEANEILAKKMAEKDIK